MRATARILPLRLRDIILERGGRRLIDNIGLDIAPGGPTMIMGPNGAGKSLFLRICHGLIVPTSGTVTWNAPDQRQAHGIVLQRPVMLRRSARANLIHALALSGLGWRQRRREADAALARFGLTALAERPARLLSGGEQQRLAIARAWTLRPQLLFLDEPTSALDPGATRAIEEMIETISAEGVKIVMATHNLGQARRLAAEVVFLHSGRLREQTPAPAFFDQPQTPEAAAFLRGDLLW